LYSIAMPGKEAARRNGVADLSLFRRLVDQYGLIVLLALFGEQEPCPGHIQQYQLAFGTRRFFRQRNAMRGVRLVKLGVKWNVTRRCYVK
jgi:hypothetical protein